jgi:dTDP-4-dehydrorhamnose 3,5-epimerase
MKFIPTPLTGAFIVEPEPHADQRGWFARTFCKKEFAAIGHDKEWVQMNHSFTRAKGSIRGMHFQFPPDTESKLVRCIAGKVFDVIIDIRQDSPEFLKWYGAELSAGNKRMLYIPEGFAHGFQTLSDDCELVYCHTSYYNAASEGAIRYNDLTINIQWPLAVTGISDKDQQHPDLTSGFMGIKL